jgi:hypothetical protein
MPTTLPQPASGGSDPVVILPRRIAGVARSLNKASEAGRGEQLRRDTQQKANISIASLRQIRESAALVRELNDSNGLASTAILNMLALSASNWYILAYQTWTQEFSREGLIAAEAILSALDTNWDYSKGYYDRRSMSALVCTALYDTVLSGGIGVELVLDSYRLPRDLIVFPYDSITWKANGRGGKFPSQKIQGVGEADLNYPTIFIAEAVKPANTQYAKPFVASGVQRLFAYESFIEDMWRVVRQAGEPRLIVKLNYEKVRAAAPPSAMDSPEGLAAHMDDMREQVQTLLSSLAPEDALVLYDLAEIDHITANGEKKDFKELLSELSGQAASAMKSNASMLGMRLGGSQNVASTESMLSTKVAQLVQTPVEEVMSRALTLAVRLYGVDAYIEFKFRPINLRPEEELEAHYAMRQNRVLEQLSLGLITDDEAQVALGLGSRPASAAPLSGTGFYTTKPADTVPASGTNARNQSIAPGGASSAGGKDNVQRP